MYFRIVLCGPLEATRLQAAINCDRSQRQLHLGTVEHALNELVDRQLDISRYDTRYKNDLTPEIVKLVVA